MAPPGMEEMTASWQSLFQNLGTGRRKRRKLRIRDALALLRDEEAAKRVNERGPQAAGRELVEQQGIVFIDEIDKVASRSDYGGPDVSREGVQRDLLPLVEGCTVSTKQGMVRTDHILFIASGPSTWPSHPTGPRAPGPAADPRRARRLELGRLHPHLDEPDASLTTQYQALLATEGVSLEFTPDGIERIAELAWQVNERTRTSVPAAAHGHGNGCSRTCRSTPASSRVAWSSTRPTSTGTSRRWRRTRTSPVTSCSTGRRPNPMSKPIPTELNLRRSRASSR